MTITLDGLGKRFNREWIFRNFSIEFSPASIYAITGPNGSGKSTLISVLSGLVPPSEGKVTYADSGVTIPVEKVFRHVSIAAPYMDLIDDFTVNEQINFHFKMRSPREGLSTADVIEKAFLQENASRYIGNLSSGLKQRLKLALAFYTRCDILLLDEPGTNLDSRAFEWYREALNEVKKGSLVIIASNNPTEYPSESEVLNVLDYKGIGNRI